MALALPAQGTCVTLDIDNEFVDLGRPFWRVSNLILRSQTVNRILYHVLYHMLYHIPNTACFQRQAGF